MALGNYSELQASIASWLARSDLTSLIPDFIVLCEADMTARLRSPANEKMDTAFTLTGRYTTLPADFAEMRRVFLNDSTRTELLPLTAAGEYYSQGTPRYYNIVGGTIEVVPLSTANTLEIAYWKKVPDLATNTTNTILTTFPNLYLYGSCLQAGYYLSDAQTIERFEPKYEQALASANGRRFQSYGAGMSVRVA